MDELVKEKINAEGVANVFSVNEQTIEAIKRNGYIVDNFDSWQLECIQELVRLGHRQDKFIHPGIEALVMNMTLCAISQDNQNYYLQLLDMIEPQIRFKTLVRILDLQLSNKQEQASDLRSLWQRKDLTDSVKFKFERMIVKDVEYVDILKHPVNIEQKYFERMNLVNQSIV
jgi:hypothetical protein